MLKISKPPSSGKRLSLSIPARMCAVIAVVAASTLGSAATASATTGNCGSSAFTGDRICYKAYIGNGEWAIMHVYTGAGGHDYVSIYGEAETGSQLYYDISFNGGSTWNGRQHVDTSGWAGMAYIGLDTEGIYDGPGTWIRACIYNPGLGLVACTPWN